MNSWKKPIALRVFLATTSFSVFWSASGMAETPDARTNSPHQSLAEKVAAEDLMDDRSETAKLKRQEVERKHEEADMKAWTRELDPLPNGGWTFRHYADDWAWALYTSTDQRKRVGDMVTLWLRWEQRDARATGAVTRYRSYVEKVEFDCSGARTRRVAQTFYPERNLRGDPYSVELNPKTVVWDSVIPGSQGEYNLQIACGTR
jgi:hypothetical protein